VTGLLPDGLAAAKLGLVDPRHILGFEAGLALGEPREAPLPCAHGLWQLFPPHALAEGVVLGPVGGRSLGEDGRDLGLDGLLAAVGAKGCVGRDLRSVQGHGADAHQTGLCAEPKDLGEATREGPLVLPSEPGDRRVVRRVVPADDAEGDVLLAAAFDLPARAFPDAVGVEQERHHHPGFVGGATPSILAVAQVEGPKVHVLDHVEHEEG
jgi:hypothetical protein